MTWKIKKLDKCFLVKGPAASFVQYSLFDAELLCGILNRYEAAGRDMISACKLLMRIGKELVEEEKDV